MMKTENTDSAQESGQWEIIEHPAEEMCYRMQERNGKLHIEYMILDDEEDGGFEWRECYGPMVPLALVWREIRQRHTLESALRAKVEEWRSNAQMVAANSIDTFMTYRKVADSIESLLTTPPATMEATGEVSRG